MLHLAKDAYENFLDGDGDRSVSFEEFQQAYLVRFEAEVKPDTELQGKLLKQYPYMEQTFTGEEWYIDIVIESGDIVYDVAEAFANQ